MAALSIVLTFSVLPVLAIGQRSRRSGVVPRYARLPASPTEMCGVNLWSGPFSIKFCSREQICTEVYSASRSAASRSLVSQPDLLLESYSRRSAMSGAVIMRSPAVHQHLQGNLTVSRTAEFEDDYGHCKNNSIQDAVMGIMSDVIQHCFKDECDGMREKVFDQMGSGLAALFRLWTGVAADAIPAPIPNKRDLADITEADLEQVRRMLELTSLPFATFHNTHDDDLKRLTNMLQTGNGQERRLTGNELSQICGRLGSDLGQCLSPLAMCFLDLPLNAKQRALWMPAEVAGRIALSLIAGPKRDDWSASKIVSNKEQSSYFKFPLKSVTEEQDCM